MNRTWQVGPRPVVPDDSPPTGAQRADAHLMSRSQRRRLRGRSGALRVVYRTLHVFLTAAPLLTSAAIVLQILTSIAGPALLGVLAWILSRVSAQQAQQLPPAAVVGPLALLFALMTLGTVSSLVQSPLQAALADKVAWSMMEKVIDVAAAADPVFYDCPPYHDHLQRARRAAATPISQLQNLLGLVGSFFAVLGLSTLLATLTPVAVAFVALSVVPMTLSRRTVAKSLRRLNEEFTENDRRRYYIQTLLTDRETAAEVRAYGLADFLRHSRHSVYAQRWRVMARTCRRATVKVAVGGLLSALLFSLAISTMVVLVLTQQTPASVAAVSTMAAFQFSSVLTALMVSVSRLYEGSVYLSDLDEFRQLYSPGDRLPPGAAVAPSRLGFEVISVENLTFRYPYASTRTLRGVSLRLARGQIVALVGGNGSGKTTLAKLLCRLYLPSSGRIMWDDTDICAMDPDEYRDRVAILFQHFARFQFTAAESIALGRIGSAQDLEAVARAAQLAGAHTFIESLSGGYDALLGKAFQGGTELSGGQWQRLALARAIFRAAPLVVLDEPTTALDPFSESQIHEGMRHLFEGRTVLLISHRLTSIQFADHIYVMDQGVIAEHGTHPQLLREGGLYAQMYRVQEDARQGGLLAGRHLPASRSPAYPSHAPHLPLNGTGR